MILHPVFPPISENRSLCTNSIIKRNYCTSTWNNLYLMINFTHHTQSNNLQYILLVSQTLLNWYYGYYVTCLMQISWLASFCSLKISNAMASGGLCSPDLPAAEIYYWNKLLLSQIPESAPDNHSCSGNHSTKFLELPLEHTLLIQGNIDWKL